MNPAPATSSLEQRVRAELVRMAYHDSLFGAPFGIVAALLVGFASYGAFPTAVVVTWLVCTVGCNAARLIARWSYFRRDVPPEHAPRWARRFVIVSAAAGASWGVAGWMFYTPQDSIYRVMVVLALAGLTTGASRLLAPIVTANLSYVYLAIVPLQLRVMVNPDTRSYVLGILCGLYLLYMSIAARQEVAALRRSIQLRLENESLVESLGSAKERAEQLNRELSAEIARRAVVEQDLRAATAHALAANRAKSDFSRP